MGIDETRRNDLVLAVNDLRCRWGGDVCFDFRDNSSFDENIFLLGNYIVVVVVGQNSASLKKCRCSHVWKSNELYEVRILRKVLAIFEMSRYETRMTV